MESLLDRLKRESLLVHGKLALRQLKKGYELIERPFSDYERRSRPSLLKYGTAISSLRGVIMALGKEVAKP